MRKIQVLNKISDKGLELFPKDAYERASEILNPDAILLRSYNMHDMDIPASVKAIARAGAGVNNIPVDVCKEQGIVVFNTPGANANAVKELVIAGLIISSRRIFRSMVWTRDLVGKGTEVPALIEKGKKQFAGPEIKGKRLGVIGLGAIGVMVANDALGLGMEVSGYDPFISIEAAWGLSRSVKREVSLEKLVSSSDYLTIHVPYNEKTNGMLNREIFAVMKKGTRLLNFARGELVNQEDLIEALENDTISFYITDFPNEELLKTDKVMAFPHLGASTYESEENCAVMAVSQLRDFLENGNIKNSVNFPNAAMERSPGTKRLVIANKNIPNMVGQITSVLAEREINIAGMINKHKDDYAFNIIDTDSEVTDDLLDKIRSIDGVVMVRDLGKNGD